MQAYGQLILKDGSDIAMEGGELPEVDPSTIVAISEDGIDDDEANVYIIDGTKEYLATNVDDARALFQQLQS